MASGGNMDEELEALRREREDKVRQLADKRRQVEELKRRRAARLDEKKAEEAAKGRTTRRASGDLGRSVDSLVAEILGTDGAAKASPDGPLGELKDRAASSAASRPAKSTAQLQTEINVTVESIKPSEKDAYERGSQTDSTGAIEGNASAPAGAAKPTGANNVLMRMAERARMRPPMPGAGGAVKPTAGGQAAPKAEAAAKIQELTREEKERITNHPDFTAFFDRASLVIERALGQAQWDLAADFKTDSLNDGKDEDSGYMKYVADYTEDRWSTGRPVTNVRFSPLKEEMFLGSYGQKTDPSLADPDGCMLVWNLGMRTRPELTFTCQSAVLTANFHNFEPALFFGGTYAGGVVLWDARAKMGPVLRTPLSMKGHSHPVQALQQVGTQNATNLVTVSNDGRLCTWSLSKWDVPQETIDLRNETKNRRDLAVTTFAFPDSETNTLYVGAEDGSVCQVHMHGSKVGVTELYDGHDGPVSGISMHPRGQGVQQGVDSNLELALTSSFDWSVKLWAVRQHQQPLLHLDVFEDYVFDVAWHPTHPAAFASVDGEGHVDLWNINKNVESPYARCEHPNGKKLAVNRCKWSIDGRKLVTGDSEGTLSVYAVHKDIAQPRADDFREFNEIVRTLQPIMPRHRESTAYGLGDMSRFAGAAGLSGKYGH